MISRPRRWPRHACERFARVPDLAIARWGFGSNRQRAPAGDGGDGAVVQIVIGRHFTSPERPLAIGLSFDCRQLQGD